jgi:hypothetical protein
MNPDFPPKNSTVKKFISQMVVSFSTFIKIGKCCPFNNTCRLLNGWLEFLFILAQRAMEDSSKSLKTSVYFRMVLPDSLPSIQRVTMLIQAVKRMTCDI